MRRSDALALALLFAAAMPVDAELVDVAPNGFTVQLKAQIAATPGKVYEVLIRPARWWSPDHTFSGKSSNLTLDARAGGCWCEKLPDGGSVAHLTAVYVDPGKTLRLRGALGPFQAYAVEGAMTWTLNAAGDGTELTLEYTLGGYTRDGFDVLSKAVDGVLGEQVANLKQAIESK